VPVPTADHLIADQIPLGAIVVGDVTGVMTGSIRAAKRGRLLDLELDGSIARLRRALVARRVEEARPGRSFARVDEDRGRRSGIVGRGARDRGRVDGRLDLVRGAERTEGEIVARGLVLPVLPEPIDGRVRVESTTGHTTARAMLFAKRRRS
jgi:hypothetical protein